MVAEFCLICNFPRWLENDEDILCQHCREQVKGEYVCSDCGQSYSLDYINGCSCCNADVCDFCDDDHWHKDDAHDNWWYDEED